MRRVNARGSHRVKSMCITTYVIYMYTTSGWTLYTLVHTCMTTGCYLMMLRLCEICVHGTLHTRARVKVVFFDADIHRDMSCYISVHARAVVCVRVYMCCLFVIDVLNIYPFGFLSTCA